MRTDLLRYLHLFAVVVECGGIREASAALAKAPSTLTRAIAALEAMLAMALFDRTHRGLRLTASGRQVHRRVRSIRAELAGVHAEALASPDRSGPVAALDTLFNEGRLRLAVALAARGHMPSVAAATCVTQPAVSQGIRHLEACLGQAIFARTPRRMAPTAQACRWIGRFERVLRELDLLRRDPGAGGAPPDWAARAGGTRNETFPAGACCQAP